MVAMLELISVLKSAGWIISVLTVLIAKVAEHPAATSTSVTKFPKSNYGFEVELRVTSTFYGVTVGFWPTSLKG